ncbi:MAG: putative oxidoreductase (related to aryl-alcohol dehydrogenase), partial [Halorubrum sp. J07HR59]
MATSAGTWDYRDRHGDAFGRTYFRRFDPGVISSVGIGTYLGEPTDRVDSRYQRAIRVALDNGVNVVDTAVNYRCGRSEAAVGRALREAAVDREAVTVATKGGFIPFDNSQPADPGAYVRDRFLTPGLVDAEDVAQGSHCISPEFIDAMVDRSLDRLGLDTIDLYYVHNPETQLSTRSRAQTYDLLEATFRQLERRRLTGAIGRYGVATWDGFRVPAGAEAYLSLPEVIRRSESAANTVGTNTPGLAAVQLPFNVAMADAFIIANHSSLTEKDGADDPDTQSTLACARDAGVSVFASASLGQGELVDQIPPEIDARLAGETAAQRAINFARSAPG